MMNRMMFCSDVLKGKGIASLDNIVEAYGAISDTISTYQLHRGPSGIDILAFNSLSPEYTTRFLNREFDLVQFLGVDFISTKVTPSFCINGAAVELFKKLDDDLKKCLKEHMYTSLIITGSGLAGYLAILSTLLLHYAIEDEEYSKVTKATKRPICITFGCPLIGDHALQQAIAERPNWKSSLLNVVAKEDPFASFFSANTRYKPLGTFLFCTESGGHSAFEDQDAILLVLNAMNLQNAGNLLDYDYTAVLSSMRRRLLHRGVSRQGECSLNSLRAGITMQLREVGVLDCISNDQIKQMEETQRKITRNRIKYTVYSDTKNLNDVKISLTYMEWYMKTSKGRGGYYDRYKAEFSRNERWLKNEIEQRLVCLNNYWKTVVEDKDQMPQKENPKLRMRWLLGATNYRRIVEPLDIARYYKNGNTNYMEKRHDHYVKLEKWLNEYMKGSKEETRNKAASLTMDSCFYAYVEEAFISLKKLVERDVSDDWEQTLKQFEVYVMDEIKKYAVSPDVFLEGSILMKWWNEYNAYKGTEYHSDFTDYMKEKMYKSYE